MIFSPLFFQPSSADCKYMPAEISYVVEDRSRSASILLGPPEIGTLVATAAAYTARMAVLPVDAAADQRMDALMALNTGRAPRRPLRKR